MASIGLVTVHPDRIVREARSTYPETQFQGFTLTKFDGQTITV